MSFFFFVFSSLQAEWLSNDDDYACFELPGCLICGTFIIMVEFSWKLCL